VNQPEPKEEKGILRQVIDFNAWPWMDVDPNHKVIVLSLDGDHRLMRLKDVPGFRPQYANPAQVKRYDTIEREAFTKLKDLI